MNCNTFCYIKSEESQTYPYTNIYGMNKSIRCKTNHQSRQYEHSAKTAQN